MRLRRAGGATIGGVERSYVKLMTLVTVSSASR